MKLKWCLCWVRISLSDGSLKINYYLADRFFRLGGPCAGKGFLCTKAAQEIEDIDHICMGDILRAERSTPGSPWAEEIERQIREGGLVRSELSMELLQLHISKALERRRRKFFLDGFPRKVDQAILFEEKVRQPRKFDSRWLTPKDWSVQSSNILGLPKRGYDRTSFEPLENFWKS